MCVEDLWSAKSMYTPPSFCFWTFFFFGGRGQGVGSEREGGGFDFIFAFGVWAEREERGRGKVGGGGVLYGTLYAESYFLLPASCYYFLFVSKAC